VAVVEFTKRSVATLTPPPGKTDHIVWDESLPGFGLRFRQTKRSWIVQYRIGAQQRRESLGDIRKVTLDDARSIARKRFASVELGVDPGLTKARAAADATAARRTLAVAVDGFLEFKRPEWRPSSYEAARRYLTMHWAPLAALSLTSITQADVADRLRGIVKEHGRVAASQARGCLVALFYWAAGEGWVERNVAALTNDPGGKSRPRDHVLDTDEIRLIWSACNDDDFGAIVKLLLLTGQRRNEVAHLRWKEVHLDAATITLPPARTKNDREHIIPLSPAALAILKARPQFNPDGSNRKLVFGAGDKPFLSWSNAKAGLEAKIAELGGINKNWVLHDLRRSCASGMQKLGMRVEVIEKALNHVSGSYRGVAGVYQRDPMEKDVRAALERWSEHVTAIVEGRVVEKRKGNVTALHA
jgi:integrase